MGDVFLDVNSCFFVFPKGSACTKSHFSGRWEPKRLLAKLGKPISKVNCRDGQECDPQYASPYGPLELPRRP